MKKVLVFAITLVLALSLAACGGGANDTPAAPPANTGNNNTTSSPAADNSTPSAPDNENGAVNHQVVVQTPSITLADGWVKTDEMMYKNTELNSNFALATALPVINPGSASDYAQQMMDTLKKTYPNGQYDAVTQSTIGGMDAAEFIFTADGSTNRKVYILQPESGYTNVYSVSCFTLYDSDFADANVDFQSMLDSFTLS